MVAASHAAIAVVQGNRPARLADAAACTLLAALALLAALTFRDYGLGWDDFTHAQYGDLLLKLYGSGLRDTRALSFVNLYYYGGGFDMASALAAKVLPFDLFETRRLVGAAVGLIGLIATWRVARRIGGPVAGLVALALLAACPLYYGHMFINPKDAPFAAAMAVFLLGLVRLLENYPRPSKTALLIVGAGFGCAIGSRILAGFGAVAAAAAIASLFAIEARETSLRFAARRLGGILLALVPAAVLATALMALLWPWSIASPLNPLRTVAYFSHFFEEPWRELFAGQLLKPPDMPRTYVLVLLALKLPVILLVLGCSGACLTLFEAVRGAAPARSRAIGMAVVLAAVLPVLAAVLTRPAMYNGVRHFVFVVPPLAVLGGLAAARVAGQVVRLRPVLFALLAGGLALPVVEMARLHPYEYVYFNELAGGIRSAQSRYMLDYWGLSLKQAALALKQAAPSDKPSTVAVCGPHPPASIALGPNFHLTWDARGADYALSLGVFYCSKLDAPLLADVQRDGVVFARVYDLREHHEQTLFATPPLEHGPN